MSEPIPLGKNRSAFTSRDALYRGESGMEPTTSHSLVFICYEEQKQTLYAGVSLRVNRNRKNDPFKFTEELDENRSRFLELAREHSGEVVVTEEWKAEEEGAIPGGEVPFGPAPSFVRVRSEGLGRIPLGEVDQETWREYVDDDAYRVNLRNTYELGSGAPHFDNKMVEKVVGGFSTYLNFTNSISSK